MYRLYKTRVYAFWKTTKKPLHPETNIPDRIQNLLEKEKDNLTEKESSFLTSISSSYKEYNHLTNGQYRWFSEIERKYSDENKQKTLENRKAEEEWSFDETKRKYFEICVNYYKHNTPYYENIVEKVNKEPNYIPSFKEYNALCNNEYAKRIIEGFFSAPRYQIDDFVFLKTNKITHCLLHKYSSCPSESSFREEKIYRVININEVFPLSSCKGNKVYTLMPISGLENKLVYVEERFLRKVK